MVARDITRPDSQLTIAGRWCQWSFVPFLGLLRPASPPNLRGLEMAALGAPDRTRAPDLLRPAPGRWPGECILPRRACTSRQKSVESPHPAQAPGAPGSPPSKRTLSPGLMPWRSTSPALTSRVYIAGLEGEYSGSSDAGVPGAGAGTFRVRSTTSQSRPIQMKSSGNFISIIQKVHSPEDSNTKSIPAPGARLSRPDRPLVRVAGLSATSATKAASPMATLTVGSAGGGEGVAVGAAVAVGAGVAVAVGR